jgi:hypothetical protein
MMKNASRTKFCEPISCCLTLVIACAYAVSSAKAKDDETSRLTGKEAEAVALAVGDFKKNQGSTYKGKPVYGDLKHYSVELRREGNNIEVVFGPDFGPEDRGPDGLPTVGGATQYGWEVDYSISLEPLKILRRDFAR